MHSNVWVRTRGGKRVRRAVGRGGQGSDPRVLGISRGAGLARRTAGSVNRSQEAAGGAVEGEALILPGRALTESCQSLHESPDRSRIRFEPFREPEGLGSLLLRQLQSRRGRIENLLAVCPKFMGGRPMNDGAIVREVRVESSAHGVKRIRPRFMDRRSNMTAP